MVNDSKLLNKLYDKLFDLNVLLFHANTGNHKAITILYKDSYGIFYNSHGFSDSYDEFEVLVHELGHIKSGSTHKLNSPYQLIRQHEVRANRCAVHEFLPLEKLLSAINNGYTELWELSETLDMPKEFIKMAIDTYRMEGKLC